MRQGGLTSPRLFNLYIIELGRAGVGCSIDGRISNNISYADNKVMLSPSVKALQTLIGICERYAESHDLGYNTKKSELLIFKAGNKRPKFVPPVKLGGEILSRVTKFKYLGHWVTDGLSYDQNIERERRALAVRCNKYSLRRKKLFKIKTNKKLFEKGLWVRKDFQLWQFYQLKQI